MHFTVNVSGIVLYQTEKKIIFVGTNYSTSLTPLERCSDLIFAWSKIKYQKKTLNFFYVL